MQLPVWHLVHSFTPHSSVFEIMIYTHNHFYLCLLVFFAMFFGCFENCFPFFVSSRFLALVLLYSSADKAIIAPSGR